MQQMLNLQKKKTRKIKNKKKGKTKEYEIITLLFDCNMERKDISTDDKWKLEDMYPSLDEYNNDIIKIVSLSDKLLTYKGKILKNSKNLYEVLKLNEELDIITSRLYVYINMKLHEDTRISEFQEK